LSSEEKVSVLSVLLLVNGSEPRRKPRKKLGNGTRHTKEAESNFQLEKRDGEENAGTPSFRIYAKHLDIKEGLENGKHI